MGRSKNWFIEMMEEMFNASQERMEKFERMLKNNQEQEEEESMEVETFEVVKNGVKSILKVKFTKGGYPASIRFECIDKIPTPEEELENRKMVLQKELESALALDTAEGYNKAAELKKQMEQLKAPNQQ